jgi:predicted transcriptional regulator
MKEDGRIQIAVRIPPELKRKLKMFLAAEGRDIQNLLEEAVISYLLKQDTREGKATEGESPAGRRQGTK